MEKTIMFYDKPILVIETEKGPYVSVKHVCDGLGIRYVSQFEKISSRPELFNCSDIRTVGGDGKNRVMFCISLERINAWLLTINANKVKCNPEALMKYQTECAQVLYKHFVQQTPSEDYSGFVSTIMSEFKSLKESIIAVHNTCKGLRDEVQELESMVSFAFHDPKKIREEIKLTADKRGVDGRTIIGELRGMFGTNGIYDIRNEKCLLNAIRTLRKEGFTLIKSE